MNAPEGESPTFAHRVVRWLAIITLCYGLLNVFSLWTVIRFQSFWAPRWWLGGRMPAGGYTLVMACQVAAQIVGAIALLRWKAWGRILLLAWSISAMLVSFVVTVGSVYAYTRTIGATTTQMSYQPPVGYYVWTWFHNWVQASTLPLVLLVTLFQGDVKKIWSGQRAGGGFDVIPMAAPADQT